MNSTTTETFRPRVAPARAEAVPLPRTAKGLSWFSIVRLGLAQTALGAIVVLTTSTLNRVMVVELALPALLPGLLVGLHYAIQMLRPRWGYGSDTGGHRTPWIIGGMAVLATGGALAAVATAVMATSITFGVLLAVFAFMLIGVGVGASGTSLLVLLATHVRSDRRAAAASIVWIMMIAGFVITATTAGYLLDPYSAARLIAVTSGVSLLAFLLTVVAVWGIEKSNASVVEKDAASETSKTPFMTALGEVWSEPQARRFTIFVFVSMLAYSMQDLILEPFAGLVFGMTPGESTRLAGVQHGGVLVGMVLVALVGSIAGGHRFGSLRFWTIGGCIASGIALAGLAFSGHYGDTYPLKPSVFLLGLANGAFAVAAIGSMMALAGSGRKSREGVRMGLWGAAQAIAFGLGGILGAAGVDIMRQFVASPIHAYGTVFAIEGLLFVVAAVLAVRVGSTAQNNEARISPFAPGQQLAENG
ncbi:MAG: BCD family MFS transporter [Pseudomonadota bacterium]